MKLILDSLSRHPSLWIQPAIVFAITVATAYLMRRIFFGALRSWVKRTQSRGGQVLTDALRGPSHIWIFILAVHFAIQSSELPSSVVMKAPDFLQVLFAISLTLMFMRVAGEMARHFGSHAPGALPVTSLTQNLAQIAVLAVGLLVILSDIGVKITPILTALGVGGLAVALALQDTLSNLFGGFWLSIAGQVRLGDYIKLNTGEEGYVSDIGWRSTVIRGLGNNMIIVPNAKLAQAIVTNYYLPEKRMSSSLQVGVSYASDVDRVEQVLLEIARQAAGQVPGLLAEPAPSVTFDPGFGDWSLNLTLNYQIAEFSNQWSVKHELRKRIFRRFREEGIDMPFPTRTVYLEQAADRTDGSVRARAVPKPDAGRG
jgi:small-conductance mechanosensitive channel